MADLALTDEDMRFLRSLPKPVHKDEKNIVLRSLLKRLTGARMIRFEFVDGTSLAHVMLTDAGRARVYP